MSPYEAAIEGTREIGPAVLATTLSLLAVSYRLDSWEASSAAL